jgi:hypothetical protein
VAWEVTVLSGLQVVLRAPAVLELSVEDTLLPRVAFLRETVGVAEENLGKVILRLPSVLTYSEESMQQRIEFLLEAGLCQEDLAKAVTSHPQVPLLPARPTATSALFTLMLPGCWLRCCSGICVRTGRPRNQLLPGHEMKLLFQPRVLTCLANLSTGCNQSTERSR